MEDVDLVQHQLIVVDTQLRDGLREWIKPLTTIQNTSFAFGLNGQDTYLMAGERGERLGGLIQSFCGMVGQ